MALDGFEQDGARYAFSVLRLCTAYERWERHPGKPGGILPFGASGPADYFMVAHRTCDKCTGWRRRYYQQERGTTVQIYVCRCRACGHEPFSVDAWRASEVGAAFMARIVSVWHSGATNSRTNKARDEWDSTTEVMQIAVDFIDAGDTEQAKLALAHQLEILSTKGLLK